MPVLINLRRLEKGLVTLNDDLPISELDLENVDELIQLHEPLHYELKVERLGSNLLVQGSLRTSLDCECVRCLKGFRTKVELDPWTLHLSLEGEDSVEVENDCVDLTPFIREDILLAFPQHPLCEAECGGLPLAQEPSKFSETEEGSSAWAELNKLKF